jgi:hypothetical protein
MIGRVAFVVVCLVVFAFQIDAETDSTGAWSTGLTREQYEALSDEEKSQLPVLEIFRFGDESFFSDELVIALIENVLCDLKYYPHYPSGEINDNLTNAIKELQHDIGAKPSGVLTAGQWFELQEIHDGLSVEPVGLPSGVFIHGGSEFARAEGTWSFDGNARPIQASKIECYKQMGACFEAMAYVDRGFPFQMDDHMLEIDLQVWEVIHWDTASIIAKNDEAGCAAYNLTIDLRTESAFQVRRGKGCEGFAESPMMVQLVDGFEIAFEARGERHRASSELVSSRYQEAFKRIAEEIAEGQQSAPD